MPVLQPATRCSAGSIRNTSGQVLMWCSGAGGADRADAGPASCQPSWS